MTCRAGSHDWLEISVEQDKRPVRLRRCVRCQRWDELRGLWTVMTDAQLA
jgi:hypothetical protein